MNRWYGGIPLVWIDVELSKSTKLGDCVGVGACVDLPEVDPNSEAMPSRKSSLFLGFCTLLVDG